MTDLCQRLDWDSDFFGFNIGRVNVNQLTAETLTQIETWCAEQPVDCLYFLADSADRQTAWLAQQGGFIYVDNRVVLTAKLTAPPSQPTAIRLSRPEDLPVLREIARTGHRDSRFYFDPVIPDNRCDDLFVTWIERSMAGAIADAVLVALVDEQPVGYSALQIAQTPEGRRAKLTLIAIGEQARGQGLGSSLVQGTLRWFWERDFRTVEVVTQGRNVGAQRLYTRQGFVPTATGSWYHRWSTAVLARQRKLG